MYFKPFLAVKFEGGPAIRYLDKERTIEEEPSMPSRAEDWLRQAKIDLAHARAVMESGFFEWGCFSAQQAAEKALKALYQHLHGEARGHSVMKLLEMLPSTLSYPRDLLDDAAALDKLYIPTRYPNGFDIGAPHDFFTKQDLQEAIRHAERIVDFCDSHISGS